MTAQLWVVHSHFWRGESFLRRDTVRSNRISFTYLLTVNYGRYSLGKKRAKSLIPPFLSDTIQLNSCFVGGVVAGDGGGRPSPCIVFSKRCDAWVSVQGRRWRITILWTWRGETESWVCELHRAISHFTLLICWPSYTLLVYFYRNTFRKEMESGCALRPSKVL